MVCEGSPEKEWLFVDHLADTKMDLLINKFQALTLRERMAKIKDEEDDSSSYHTAPESISAGDEVDTQGKVDWYGGSSSYHTASEHPAEDEEEQKTLKPKSGVSGYVKEKMRTSKLKSVRPRLFIEVNITFRRTVR